MTNIPGEINVSYLLPRFQAAKIPSTEPIEKEKITAVPAKNNDHPNAPPNRSDTERG